MLKDNPHDFWEKVQRSKVQLLEGAGIMHPVFQAELLPIVVAAKTWWSEMLDRDVFLFLDHEVVRIAMVKGCVTRLIGDTSLARSGAAAWIARVPPDTIWQMEPCQDWMRCQPEVPESMGSRQECFCARFFGVG